MRFLSRLAYRVLVVALAAACLLIVGGLLYALFAGEVGSVGDLCHPFC